MTLPLDPSPGPSFPEMESILESIAKIQILITSMQDTAADSEMTREAILALSSNIARTEKEIQKVILGLSQLLGTNKQRLHPQSGDYSQLLDQSGELPEDQV